MIPEPGASGPTLPQGQRWVEGLWAHGVGLLLPGYDGVGLALSAGPSCACVSLYRPHLGRGCEGESGRGDHLQPPWSTGTAPFLLPCHLDVAHWCGSPGLLD